MQLIQLLFGLAGQQLEEDVGQSLGFILGLPEAFQLFDGLGQRGVRGVPLDHSLTTTKLEMHVTQSTISVTENKTCCKFNIVQLVNS